MLVGVVVVLNHTPLVLEETVAEGVVEILQTQPLLLVQPIEVVEVVDLEVLTVVTTTQVLVVLGL